MKERKCTSYIERKKHFHEQAMRYGTQTRLCASSRRNGNKTTMSSSSSATASSGLKKRKQTPPLLCTFKYNRKRDVSPEAQGKGNRKHNNAICFTLHCDSFFVLFIFGFRLSHSLHGLPLFFSFPLLVYPKTTQTKSKMIRERL